MFGTLKQLFGLSVFGLKSVHYTWQYVQMK